MGKCLNIIGMAIEKGNDHWAMYNLGLYYQYTTKDYGQMIKYYWNGY